jgi:hypothetical protein
MSWYTYIIKHAGVQLRTKVVYTYLFDTYATGCIHPLYRKHNVSEIGSVSVSHCISDWGQLSLMDPTEYVSPSPHLKTEIDPVSATMFSRYLAFRAMDRVHNPVIIRVVHLQNPVKSDVSETTHFCIFPEPSWISTIAFVISLAVWNVEVVTDGLQAVTGNIDTDCSVISQSSFCFFFK